jgi:hypothetical protein
MKNRTLYVFFCPEGGMTYLGECTNLKEAKHMAAQHNRGELLGLEASQYGTARAVGPQGVNGLCPPPAIEEETVAFFGRGGNYCACLAEPLPNADLQGPADRG